MTAVFRKVVMFYIDGFRSMTVGRKLWIIIIIKLFVMFAILKIFFFKDFLGERFENNPQQKSNYVLEQITK